MDKKTFESYSQSTHNKIINWTENCDSKISIMLALLSVSISILFTSSYITNAILNLIKPIVTYCRNNIGEFYFIAFICISSLLAALCLFTFSFIFLIKGLTANIDKTNENENSIHFFGTLQNMDIEKYKLKIDSISDDEIKDDILNQIYICSEICTKKFKAYNKAVGYIKYGFLFLFVFLIFTFIKNSL